ncbi:Sec-independent protein translocase protein TatB [Pseudoxanthomonas sacheonensis]|uniref:Sec-independent protein translocase protein TatB n=1 Tax=Pseudoxanthomonas sacheonensis TaxID=443615 RepID=UPI0013D2FFFA|nr:Sec-independent protein translocase protein TatB [Pseudoxanthomonas sacheonensis]KAF1710205.1 twin-arginine translocase subunit TatB [Pseudoxanthomonas sacheonensis]
MFGISGGELFFIAIIALIVLGPERLPKVARMAGMWVRRARNQWDSVKDELERELAAEELKRSLHDAKSALQDTEQRIRDSGAEARREFEQMRASVREPDASADASAPTSDEAASDEPASPSKPQEGQGDEPRNA